MSIHPTAVIDPRARLAEGVEVRAGVTIVGAVEVGPGCVILERSHVEAGHQAQTVLGANCRIGPGAYVGTPPQHLRADLEIGHCVLGEQVIVREAATINRSTKPGAENATRVSDRCFLMAASHVGHDSVLEADVTLANAVLLAGHVTVGSRAFLGGMSGFHQFVRVGRLAIVGGGEICTQDVPPFAAVRYGRLKGYNAVGCRRASLSPEARHALRAAYKLLRKHRVVGTALAAIRQAGLGQTPEVAEMLAFVMAAKRGIMPSAQRAAGGAAETGDEE